ncbi:unnamed protein product [Medioppia subpectinata]|uniref:IMD domain-containing protein n=1 Tax=Medioppia subpectinata TaxID=1979941 RepID=A0A7R9PXA9_9ACAR|nr:unnamed protein product [Medioppia subpectinata]CAG2104202.1 unnamed protein product [Medioppia subpectinata]
MEPQFVVERDCNALGGLFQIIINDLKSGTGNWDDFVVKAGKFHTQLKATISASTAFLDAFQKIADMATSTRGGTKEIGTALTRICLRHRSVEARLKTFTSSIMDCLILPLQDRIEEWKKTCGQLDKEHSKEYKRLRQELKKKQSLDPSHALYASTSNTLRFKKHVRNKMKIDSNNWNSLNSMSRSMDSMEANERLFIFEEMEKKAVRRALIEERSHFCLFVNFLRPVVEEELAMLQEVTHLQEIMDALSKLTADPYSLPTASELVISDLRLSTSDTVAFSLQTPPSSPSSFGSRKSSMCSISSFNSSSSGSTHSPSHNCRYRSLSQVSSLSEHSSGSTSSTSSIPASNKRNDTNLRSHSISTFDKNQNLSKSHDSYSLNIINTCEENLVSINTQNNHNSSTIVLQTPNNRNITDKPDLPSRALIPDKPSIPTKPYTLNNDTNQRQTAATDLSLYSESHPIYANSMELMGDESSVACSEGSITPTNAERSNSPSNELLNQCKNSSLSASTLTIGRLSKPPPPPPVRRTSTISNPNAITLGTLKTAGCNTYEEIQNLSKTYSTYQDINSLTLSLQNLSSIETSNQPIYSRPSDVIYSNTSHMTSNSHLSQNKATEYHSAKSLFESTSAREVQQQQYQQHMQPIYTTEEQSTSLPLPAPPPEAFSDTESTNHSHHYNKITNVHRQFLETLNTKLGQFKPESHISPQNLVSINTQNNHNSSTIVLQTPNNRNITDKPDLPSRALIPDKPSIPTKPYTLNNDTNQRQTAATDLSLYSESHPIYANSMELMGDESSVACSEGSITPTNAERSNSPSNELLNQCKNSSLSASTLTIGRLSKPPPPPPVRRTSTISNPNAITLGTLKTAGCNTYEEIQNLSKTYSTYQDINSLTLSLQNLSSIETSNQPIYSRPSDVIYSNTSHMTSNSHISQNKATEYHSAKSLFESTSAREVQQQQYQQHMQPIYTTEEQS